MIGFFEHQYLSYKKNHLSNLIALAQADGHLHKDEEDMLYKVGAKYGLKDRQIASLLSKNNKVSAQLPDNHDDKMDQLYDLIMMVHADGVVEESEIKFCEELVSKFGYKKSIVKWLLEEFEKGNPPTNDAWEDLKVIAAAKYLA